jgi:hypothetical protein
MPFAYDVHPEFGYFCPAPRVRRELRVAVVSILVGMVIGAAIVTIRAGHSVETDGISSKAHLNSSDPETLVAGVAGSSSNRDNVKADPAEAIKPYPMRMVRVRSSKAVSARAAPPEPDIPPAPAGPASPENAEASGSPAASPQAKLFAAAGNSAVSRTKRRPSAMHARRHRDDEDENARWQSRRWPYWGERAYAEDRSWRGAYRNWVYR